MSVLYTTKFLRKNTKKNNSKGILERILYCFTKITIALLALNAISTRNLKNNLRELLERSIKVSKKTVTKGDSLL